MKYLFLLSLSLVVFTGCSKIKEAKALTEGFANVVETAKAYEGLDSSADDFDPAKFSMSEREVREFYKAVSSLMEKHPTVHFEVPFTAIAESMEAGINLKRTVESGTKYTFEDFNKASLEILTLRMHGAGSEIAKTFDTGLLELEGFDMSQLDGLDDEQRASIQEGLASSRSEIEKAKEELNTPEMKKIRANYDMVMKVRSEFNLPD